MVVFKATEGGVLEGEPLHPGTRANPLAFGSQQSPHLLEIRDAIEVDTAAHLTAHQEVLVTIGQSRGEMPIRARLDHCVCITLSTNLSG
jgi:hypothetical protein